MQTAFERTEALLGKEAFSRVQHATVALFGVGGVGGYTAEALARCGIGHIFLYDGDTVSVTNLNRQIIALRSTVGKEKTAVMAERIRDISPITTVTECPYFVTEDNIADIDFSALDYVIDAIDDVRGKVAIIKAAKEAGVSVISSMGTGNKLDPLAFRIADISKTRTCPLARTMRRALKEAGISNVKVLYSEEEPRITAPLKSDSTVKRNPPASVSFVPSVAGLIIAGEVIRDLADIK